MLGHIGINVPDLEQARSYYDALTPLLGFEPYLSDEDQFAYMPAAGRRGAYLFFSPARGSADHARENSGLQHLAFNVPTRSAVRCIHQHVVDSGGHIVHEPREFPEYPPPYFATFWLDPFGFMLEAVCLRDRE